MTTQTKLTQADLSGFTGSESFYRHWIVKSLVFTDGVKFVAEHGSFWLIDAIASALAIVPAVARSEFRVCTFIARPKRTGVLKIVAEEQPDVGLYQQSFDYAECPLDELTFWLIDNGEGNTLLLPSEY